MLSAKIEISAGQSHREDSWLCKRARDERIKRTRDMTRVWFPCNGAGSASANEQYLRTVPWQTRTIISDELKTRDSAGKRTCQRGSGDEKATSGEKWRQPQKRERWISTCRDTMSVSILRWLKKTVTRWEQWGLNRGNNAVLTLHDVASRPKETNPTKLIDRSDFSAGYAKIVPADGSRRVIYRRGQKSRFLSFFI